MKKLIPAFLFILVIFFSSGLNGRPKDYFVYVSFRSSDAIGIYKLNSATGEFNLIDTQKVEGGPAAPCLDPTNKILYSAQRTVNSFSSFIIDNKTGRISLINNINVLHIPVYISTDKTGKYFFAAFYCGHEVASYKIGEGGKIIDSPVQIDSTFKTPHSILTDDSNKHLYVADKDGDRIQIYNFDEQSGTYSTFENSSIAVPIRTGPRHFVFSNNGKIVYFVNEINSSITGYNVDLKSGLIKPFQTISTLPDSFYGKNTAADIHITPDDKFLYASNRGDDSIAGYSIDEKSGMLKLIGFFKTEKTPRAFNIDPNGNYLIAAGENSDSLAVYKINNKNGNLTQTHKFQTGKQPSWILFVECGN